MNKNFDKVQNNLPIPYSELNKLWIYEGNNELDFTPFAGKYFNRASKGLLVDIIYMQKIIQINKSILSALEGNFTIYNPTKIYTEGDVVLNNNKYYISLTDKNNKALDDLESWYSFQLKLNQFFMVDEDTEETYKITLNNGELKLTKV